MADLKQMVRFSNILAVYSEREEDREEAQKLAGHLGVCCLSEKEDASGYQLLLRFDARGLTLAGQGQEMRGDLTKMLPRLKLNNLRSELLVKAAKIKEKADGAAKLQSQSKAESQPQSQSKAESQPQDRSKEESQTQNGSKAESKPQEAAGGERNLLAIDATAGMGEDSILLAAAGFRVRMYEQDPVICALLKDSLKRAALVPELSGIVSRMEVCEENSIEAMRHLPEQPDVIVLDPMFPERQKSALVKKKFQLLHQLEQPCSDEEAMLEAAIAACPRKIAIKRPVKGPYLAAKKPDYSLAGKAVRYDCFVFARSREQKTTE